MNAAEQRAHRTVTQSLEQRIEALETLTLQISKNCDWLKAQSDEHAKRIAWLTDETTRISRFAVGFHSYPFSARLRWLFRGR